MATTTPTLTLVSSVTTTSSVHKVFSAGKFTCHSDTNVRDDKISEIYLSVDNPLPPAVAPAMNHFPGGEVSYYARAEWRSIGDTSYHFADTVPEADRDEIRKAFDQIFAQLKTA